LILTRILIKSEGARWEGSKAAVAKSKAAGKAKQRIGCFGASGCRPFPSKHHHHQLVTQLDSLI